MSKGDLGRTFKSGEIIARQGDVGDCMYVIQEGRVQVLSEEDGVETPLRVASEGEFLGEMAIFDRVVRSATLKALDEVRLLTIDKKNFLKRIHEDPSLAFKIVQTMSLRVRELGDELTRLRREAASGEIFVGVPREQDH
jgi:CRP-like cAMP-binding protein